MHLKNTLIGAVIGGAIGIGLLIAAYFLFGAEHTAFAILVAVLVGLGVRAKVSTKGHPSYLRGALTALLAIAAFVGGKFLVAEIAARQVSTNSVKIAKAPTPPPTAAEVVSADEEETADAETTAAEVSSEETASEETTQPTDEATPSESDPTPPEPEETPSRLETMTSEQSSRTLMMGEVPRGMPRKSDFSAWDFLWLFAAALIAYELGRGSGASLPAPAA